jgi:predicted nucleotidyltransferase
MSAPAEIAANDERLLGRLTAELSKVPGVRAIVLGGSRARGVATPRSDYDIGLYYQESGPIDVALLQGVVATLDDAGPTASVTPIGGWGPWINGGGWLTVAGTRVDLLYRSLDRARSAIEACRAGRIERHYQPGHPHAFISTIYMGEVAYCRPLWDPSGILAQLKQQTLPYPQPLRQAIVRSFLWEARFALENARHGRAIDDPVYVAGCCFRCMACLCQVLFAINGIYLLNEKGAVPGAERLPIRPQGFSVRVNGALHKVGIGSAALAVQELEGLVAEVEALAA